MDSNSSARQTSCFQNSVEKPMTAQMWACRLRPVDDVGVGLVLAAVPARVGPEMASLSASVKRKSCGVFCAVPAIGAARSTLSGNRTAHS